MKKKLLAFSLALSFSSASGILHAEGNISAGKEKAASCVSCHGDNGNSMVSTFPKLAQQHSSYLINQLQAFKNGTRNNPMMSAIAMGLTDKDMLDIAAYYAAQKISANELPVLDDEDEDDKPAEKKSGGEDKIQSLIAQGSDLYRNGDLTREVSACIACHGPFGEGNKPAAFPALRSQHADYIIKALTDFKSGSRSNNPENMMHMIAKKMTDEEIKAVAYRISMMK
ncbi:MAG: c-type cytochrome [Methylococcales bacterium]|nr:c-type cytochrome [Methylococcales bacterium]